MAQIFQELAGLAVLSIGALPLIETLRTGSFRWRGDPERTTRKQDPVGYWGVVVATTLLAIVSLTVGVGVFLGLVPLHRP